MNFLLIFVIIIIITTQSLYNANDKFPKVAVCIAGELRTFVLQDVQDNLKNALFHNQISIDSYFQVSLQYSNTWHSIPDEYMSLMPNDYNKAIATIEKWNPINYTLKTNDELQNNIKWKEHNRQPNWGPLTHLSFRWSLCMDDIEYQEQKRGIKYEWIIRLRPDIIWSCKLPTDLRFWPSSDVTFFHDLGVIMKREHSTSMRIYDSFSKFEPCINQYDPDPEFCQFLFPFLHKSKVSQYILDRGNNSFNTVMVIRYVCLYCYTNCYAKYNVSLENDGSGCVGQWPVVVENHLKTCRFNDFYLKNVADYFDMLIDTAKEKNHKASLQFLTKLKDNHK